MGLSSQVTHSKLAGRHVTPEFGPQLFVCDASPVIVLAAQFPHGASSSSGAVAGWGVRALGPPLELKMGVSQQRAREVGGGEGELAPHFQHPPEPRRGAVFGDFSVSMAGTHQPRRSSSRPSTRSSAFEEATPGPGVLDGWHSSPHATGGERRLPRGCSRGSNAARGFSGHGCHNHSPP